MRRWLAAAALVALYFGIAWSLGGITGLTRTVTVHAPDRGPDTRRVPTIDVADVDATARAAGITATWQGVWEIRAGGLYDLALESRGRSAWRIDGVIAAEASSDRSAHRTVWLDAGFHPIVVVYQADDDQPNISVAAAPQGDPPHPLAVAALKPRPPTHPRLRAMGAALRTLLGWAIAVAAVFLLRKTIATLASRWRLQMPGWTSRVLPAAVWLVLGAIVVHGALLRIDAITGRYGVSSPRWLAAIQTRTVAPPASIRPAAIVWDPEPLFPHKDAPATHYRSDPYVYLDAARHMRSFYTAHFREPLFPFITKIFLWMLSDQDVAVSVASTFFSTLAIVLTYLVGASLWSRAVGLLAALAFSLDIDVISRASLGWRDDAYVAAVALCAYLMLRWWQKNTSAMAAAVGVAAGLAVLTRFMALSFVIAGVAWMVIGHGRAWRRYLKPAGLAAAAAILVAAPYFINCWRVFGDPLYTFNVHGGIYSLTEHQGAFEGSTASYVTEKIARSPIEAVDTVVQGLTTYPFMNKWDGLNQWWPNIATWAKVAALAGLVLFTLSARGRLLLLLLVSALIPFSFTWTIDPDYRFTEFAYPLFLTAAAFGLVTGVRGVRTLLTGGDSSARRWRDSDWRSSMAIVAIGVALFWCIERVTPPRVAAETLRLQHEVSIATGSRDRAFYQDGWSDSFSAGNVTFRVTRGDGVIAFRLPAVGDYSATLRMDPFPRIVTDATPRLPEVELFLNGKALSTIGLTSTPGRVGAYDVVLPRDTVRAGVNRLVIRIKRPATVPPAQIRPGLSDGDAIAVWMLRLRSVN